MADQIETLQARDAFVVPQAPAPAQSEALKESAQEIKKLKRQLDKQQAELDILLVARDGGIGAILRELKVPTTREALHEIQKLMKARGR
jgi:hypothetical protein